MTDVTQEASRLQASLRGMKAGNALLDAEALLEALALGDLAEAAAALQRIDDQLPHGALAGFVRVRLKHLAGIIDSMQDDTTPPTAA